MPRSRMTMCWVGLLLTLAPPSSGAQPATQARSVTCTATGDPAHRVFVLEPAGSGWRLSFKSDETRQAWIRLTLPNARPELTETTAALAYHNANGGRQVTLRVEPATASLDVWVDHGLEVNIEPDLDPRVDLMNTHGPLANAQCRIEQAPGVRPQAARPSGPQTGNRRSPAARSL